MTTTLRPHDPLDISSLAFWAKSPSEREPAFDELRRERPLSWHRPVETELIPDEDDPGFWALVTHADVTAVSRDAETWGSGMEFGGVMMENVPEDIIEMAHSILSMDDPRHGRLRKIISSVFTPRRVRLIEDQIAAQAAAIVDDLGSSGEVNFVSAVSARLPMWTISEMIGVPPEDRQTFTDAANAMVGWNDEEYLAGRDGLQLLFDSLMTLHGGAYRMAEERAEDPRDDLITALVQAEVDGQKLTPEEIAAFFVLLSVAGNDTTRQTTTHGLLALHRHPDQREYLMADFEGRIDRAIDELLRWATPVLTFKRTARKDTEIRGQHIAAGEKAVLFYHSANRDESVFPDPYRFDLTRDPNPHVAFGGGGPHFCLGASLARVQLRAIFSQVLHRLPNLEVIGEPVFLRGNFIHGIKRLPVRY
ncbi:cytochrome P450 [Sporichthya polymorpha]|uniref:cytochrome P450 n=1 Tax=Sporichthya polymorpha TaxID=35751 RepID=UPI000375177E|nr:cytochrome P450 [Sporichthya polymorpha]